MPHYDLSCPECGTAREVYLQRFIRDADRVCSTCGSTNVRVGVGGGYVVKKRSTQAPTCRPGGAGGFG